MSDNKSKKTNIDDGLDYMNGYITAHNCRGDRIKFLLKNKREGGGTNQNNKHSGSISSQNISRIYFINQNLLIWTASTLFLSITSKYQIY